MWNWPNTIPDPAADRPRHVELHQALVLLGVAVVDLAHVVHVGDLGHNSIENVWLEKTTKKPLEITF